MAEESRVRSVLWDRYEREAGRVHLTGLQALVRLAMDQVRYDLRAGRRVASVVAGGTSAPVERLATELRTIGSLLHDRGVRFVDTRDEVYAAGVVSGTQALDLFPRSRFEGLLGAWFGSGTDLENALGVIRRANCQGLSRHGGALAVVVDDGEGRFGGLPTHSERALVHAGVPILCPADAADILSLGRHAWALSRFAGVWSGLRLPVDVAYGGMVLELGAHRVEPRFPKVDFCGRAFEKRLEPSRHPAARLRAERELVYERLEAVASYAEINELNPIEHPHAHDEVGLVACGALYRELQSVLGMLGLDAKLLGALGIRILRMQLVYPCPEARIREFARGLSELVVLDERRGFLEGQVRMALGSMSKGPRIFGQYGPDGAPWFGRLDRVTAATLASDLAGYLLGRSWTKELAPQLRESWQRVADAAPLEGNARRYQTAARLVGARVRDLDPAAAIAGAEQQSRDAASTDVQPCVKRVWAEWDRSWLTGDLPEAGPGAGWAGLEPYVDVRHRAVRLDPSIGWARCLESVRRAVEIDCSLTFVWIEPRRDIAMPPILDRVRDLLAAGVGRAYLVSLDPALVALTEREPRLTCIPPERRAQAREQLVSFEGVSAWIEEVGPVARSSRARAPGWAVPQAAVECDWPEWFEFEGEWQPGASKGELEKLPLHEPESRNAAEDDRCELILAGAGCEFARGLLVRAAEIQGLGTRHLESTVDLGTDRTPIVQCVFARFPVDQGPVDPGPMACRRSPDVSHGADVVLVFDANLDPRTVGWLGGERDRRHLIAHAPFERSMLERPERAGDPPGAAALRQIHVTDAGALARTVLGDAELAPLILVGMVFQAGLLPLTSASLECAIRDLGEAVEARSLALRLGRAVVAAPVRTEAWRVAERAWISPSDGDMARLERSIPVVWAGLREQLGHFQDRSTARSLERQIGEAALDLADYQSWAYAAKYISVLKRWLAAEFGQGFVDRPRLAARAADVLYRLMAYRDAYEVARIRLRGRYRRWLMRRTRNLRLRHVFRSGGGAFDSGPTRMTCSASLADPWLRVLVLGRKLRGTPLDLLQWLPRWQGRRKLAEQGCAVLEQLASKIQPEELSNVRRALSELHQLAEQLRGPEQGFMEARQRSLEQLAGRGAGAGGSGSNGDAIPA